MVVVSGHERAKNRPWDDPGHEIDPAKGWRGLRSTYQERGPSRPGPTTAQSAQLNTPRRERRQYARAVEVTFCSRFPLQTRRARPVLSPIGGLSQGSRIPRDRPTEGSARAVIVDRVIARIVELLLLLRAEAEPEAEDRKEARLIVFS